MTPISLEFCAFGPFRDKTIIDFTPFHGDIFLLTGETGAGKTSIFDAISFALFGEASGGRERRSGKSFRSDYANAETPTYVEFVFREGGKLCTVRRSPEYERAKKRGTGTTRVGAEVSLCVEGEERVITRMDEADARICEIIGLDHRQFYRTVMIAQGDFLRILNAGSDERRAMFQNLFHTEIYAAAEDQLREQSRLCKNKREALTAQIRAAAARAACLPDFDRALTFDRTKENAGEHPAAFAAVLEEYNGILKDVLGKGQQAQKSLEAHTSELLLALNAGETQNGMIAEREALRASTVLSETEEQRYITEQAAIRAAQNALRIRPHELALKAREKEEADAAFAVKQANERVKDAVGVFDAAKVALQVAQAAAEEMPALEAEARRLQNAAIALLSFGKAKNRLDEAAKTLAAARDLCRTAEAEYARLRDLFWLGQAGLLAERLRTGEACPVCGALTHPAPAVRQEQTPSREQLDHAEAEEKKLRGRFHTATGEFERAQGVFQTAKETLDTCGVTNADTPQGLEDALKVVQKQRNDIREALDCAVEADRMAAEDKTAAVTACKEAEKRLALAQEQVTAAQSSFHEALTALHFDTEDAYREALCDEGELTKREKALREAQETRDRMRGRLTQLETHVGDKEAVDLSVLTAEQERLAKQVETLLESNRLADRILSGNESTLEELRALILQKENNEKNWMILEDLYHTVGGVGRSGRAKLSLEGYVQRYYFREVISAANRRLTVLTDENYVLRCRETAKDMRSKADLDLEVLDRSTGLWRDVNTLSGGESFMASLALAVGLSDVVQNRSSHVHLDMLFIDEGFGSLDEETLRRAMDLLLRLSDGKRTVGVISHIAELRERIDKKLVVTHTQRGSVVRAEY